MDKWLLLKKQIHEGIKNDKLFVSESDSRNEVHARLVSNRLHIYQSVYQRMLELEREEMKQDKEKIV